LSQRYQL